MPIVVVATLQPLPEHREEVISIVEATIERVHKESGCELYALHEEGERLIMIEKWTDEEAVGAHAGGDPLREMQSNLEGKVTGQFQVQVLQPHPAGTTKQGQL